MSYLATDPIASEAVVAENIPHQETRSITIPEESPREWGIALTIGVLSCLYLLAFRRVTILNPDEGLSLEAAQRILHGQIPYRDFFSLVTPGSYYWTSLLFKVFGNSILTARTALVVYGGIFSLLTYLLARRVCSRRNAALGACLLTITCLPFYFVFEHNRDSTLWALLALYCAVRWLETARGGRQKAESSRQKAAESHSSLTTHHSSLVARLSAPSLWALAAGSFASLTCLFEQSKGGGLVLGLALGFFLIHSTFGKHHFFTREPLAALARKDSPQRARSTQRKNSVLSVVKGVREWIYAALGFVWPFVLTIVYFAMKHSLKPMLADWLWPLKHYNSVNHVPYGFMHVPLSELDKLQSSSLLWKLFAVFTMSPGFVIAMLPILAVVLLGCRLYKVRAQRAWDQENAYYVLVCSCIVGLLLSMLDARPNFSHLMYLAPIFYLVLCWIFEGKAFGGTALPAARPAITMYLLLSFAAFGLAMLIQAGNAHRPLVSRRGTLRTTDQDTAVSYVQAHVPAGSEIFVYPYQPLYYYLTDSGNPTSYDFLYEGFNTSAQFGQTARQLEADHTPVVLLCPSFLLNIGLNAFPGTPLKVVAQRDPMVNFIFSRYHPCKVLHSTQGLRYVFMVRKDLACPGDPVHEGLGHAQGLTTEHTESAEKRTSVISVPSVVKAKRALPQRTRRARRREPL